MYQAFAAGHKQLIDAQTTGLAGAWRRAAEASARSPRRARGEGQVARLVVVGLGAVAFFAAVVAIAVIYSIPLSERTLDADWVIASGMSAAASNTFGWIAAALMVATFSCRDPLWMRPLAVCTNVAFAGYACFAGLAPVLVLHSLLLPINLLRWWQSVSTFRARDGHAGASNSTQRHTRRRSTDLIGAVR
jgi:hypothetical protein